MGAKLESFVKWLAICLLPQPILYRLWHWRRRSRPRTGDANASQIRTITIQSGARLEVYWNTNKMGPGPSVSLYVLDEEIYRIDCFGGTTGHLHINPVQANLVLGWATTPRFFFPPGDMQEQVERAAFELTANTTAALQTNQLASVRKFSMDKRALDDAVDQMSAYMKELMLEHGYGEQAATAVPQDACSE